VTILVNISHDIPELAINRIGLRLIMFNLLNFYIQQSSPGEIEIHAERKFTDVVITVMSKREKGESKSLPEQRDDLEIAKKIAIICGGNLTYTSDGDLSTTLKLPIYRKVFLIDDNSDFHQLLQRYFINTPYRLTGTTHPQEAIEAIETILPEIVIIDVMMPHMDGWEILRQLKVNPRTKNSPVIVCTILPQQELALSLGASGFIRKPITREVILNELDQLFLSQGQRLS
jgi:CheY-like chemotaxis protein